MELQVFRRRNKVVCVKAGWIAVDIPYEWKIHQVELRGISTASEDQGGGCYWDIALDGMCILHIMKHSHYRTCAAFYWELLPF